jgi:hypothetical protein
MHKRARHILIALTVVSLLTMPLAAWSAEQDSDVFIARERTSGVQMVGDALVVRPASIVCLALSSVVYVVAIPFAAMGGNAGETTQRMIKDPFVYAFKRPMGDF